MPRRTPFALLLVALLPAIAVAHADPGTPGERAGLRIESDLPRTPWTHLDFRNDPGNFQFLVVTDRTGGARIGVFPDALRKAQLLQPEFIMSVGDLIEGYTEDEAEIRAQWEEFDGFLEHLEIPFFHVPGNHDVSNPVMAKIWLERFGKNYYHFRYRDVLFLCLDSEDDGRARIGEEQVEYFRKAVAENSDAAWTMVFVHRPLWNGWDGVIDPGWLAIEGMISEMKYTVLAGHVHRYTKYVRKDRRYIVLATTGGGSDLRGPEFGEFDHVAWVTMTDQGPVLANLLLDGIHDEDVFTDEFVAMRKGLERFEVTPFVWDREGKTVARPALRFVNEEDLPMQVDLRVGQHPGLKSVGEESFTVQPNSVYDFPLHNQPTSRAWDYDHVPIVVGLNTRYEPEGREPIEYSRELKIACERLDDIPDAPDDLKLDGALGEWGMLDRLTRPMHSGSASGPDGFAKFAVARDDETIYLGVNVRDDKIVPQDASGRGWNHDYVEIRFDPRPFAGRSIFTRQWDNRKGVYLSCFAGAEAGEAKIWNRKDFPAGLRAVQKPTAKGYDMEIAVPLAYLEERGGAGDLSGFSLNVTVIDWDDPEGEKKSSSWHPDWHTEEAVIGAGAFRVK